MSFAEVARIQKMLDSMEEREIWPNGLRYLWTDAFGLVLYLSLYKLSADETYLRKSRVLVDEVYRVLGRQKGLRIGEEEDRDGQYYHYLAMWIYALTHYGRVEPGYTSEAIRLVKQIHPHFVLPDYGVIWKMKEDLSGPYPGYGLGSMDAFDGYVMYKLLDADALAEEIEEMHQIISREYENLFIDQDLGLGMMLWLSHFFPEEPWAQHQRKRSLRHLDSLWVDTPGYFCRQQGLRSVKFAFTNYGISLGLQAVNQSPERVRQINDFFSTYRSNDEYDTNAITHVMACTSHFPGLFIQGADG